MPQKNPATLPDIGRPFAEAPAWQTVAEGWRPLFGSFAEFGFSFEWHDFRLAQPLDWAKSFHPGSIELCLNLSGAANFNDGHKDVTLQARGIAFYHSGDSSLSATRLANQRHQFITVEYSRAFLASHLGSHLGDLNALVRSVASGTPTHSQVILVSLAGVELSNLVESLRRPPVAVPAQRVWFASKASELAAQFFFQPADEALFCSRAKRTGRERVEQAQAILRSNLQSPPPLEELARQVGCSHYYLSRTFSNEVGMTIQQYLRHLRLERAAELLRTGKCNVTEAAFEVGYSSLSHFSTAFHEAFGCCPGLFPLKIKSPN